MNIKKEYPKLDAILFPVSKIDGMEIMPHLAFNKPFSHFVIADLKEGKRVLNSCSPTYHLQPNSEIMVPILEGLREQYDKVEVNVKNYTNSKFFVDFVIKDNALKADKKGKDLIFPRIRVNNSYDGSLKYSHSMGFYRLVCSNGLSVPVAGTERVKKFMHTPGMGDEFSGIGSALEDFGEFTKSSKKIFEGFQPMIAEKYSTAKEAAEELDAVVKEADFPKSLVANAHARLLKESELGFGLTDFLIYNSLNHALYHSEETQMKDHKRDKVDFEVLDYFLAKHS